MARAAGSRVIRAEGRFVGLLVGSAARLMTVQRVGIFQFLQIGTACEAVLTRPPATFTVEVDPFTSRFK